jgi:hypothetical protein
MTIDAPAGDATAAWLAELQIPFEYVEDLDLARVDVKASLRNQARFQALDDDVVERYAEDMARGDVFPPIIARRVGRSGLLVVLGGNHRFAAAHKARAPLAAYLIGCSDEVALRIAYEDNRRHGLPASDEERIAHATHLMAIGWTLTAAATAVGVSVGKVQRSQQSVAANGRATELGVKGFDALPQSTRWRLAAITSDPVFTAAAQLVVDAGLTTTEAFELVTPCNAARSEAAALALVDDARRAALDRVQLKAAGRTAGPRAPTTARVKLQRALTEISILRPADVAASTLPDQRADLHARVKAVALLLMDIDNAITESARARR